MGGWVLYKKTTKLLTYYHGSFPLSLFSFCVLGLGCKIKYKTKIPL
jgi:hypothetical protein